MARKRRIRNVSRLIVLVAALAATYGIFTVAAMRVALRAREVPVPKVVGLDLEDAGRAMEAAGLALRVDDSRPFSDAVPPDGLPRRTRPPASSCGVAAACASG